MNGVSNFNLFIFAQNLLKLKRTLLLLLTSVFTTFLNAQVPVTDIFILHFADKAVNKSAEINPSTYLSNKSIERRLKQQIAFDQSDIPVNEQYIGETVKAGARILTRSRWFNTVVVEANSEAAGRIGELPFVLKIERINKGTKQFSVPVSEKTFFDNETVYPYSKEFTRKVATDIYDYGGAYNQINQLKGQYLHNLGYAGQGMTIAVIDAGFNSVDKMTCFDSLRANNQILGTHDFAQPGNNVYATTMHTHGTMVLSCMGANSSGQMVGTAPKANYWLLRSEVAETESIIEEYYWVSAAEFADSVGADLINSSLGYTDFKESPEANHTYADMDGNTTVVTKGADKAAQKGILVVNSAGNSGGSGWWYIGAPADGDSVFSIGAVNAAGVRASFSSVGPTFDRRIKPTVAGQGVGSAVYDPTGLLNANGTSFSSPIICGITACLWQAFPDLNNMQIIEAIKLTASQANHPDSLLGWGIPDYSSALKTLSVPYNNAVASLLIYPNPVTDKLTIGLPFSLQGIYSLEIVDLQGKVVYSRQRDEGSIRSLQIDDVKNIKPGIYFIKVSNGSLISTGKIIKI